MAQPTERSEQLGLPGIARAEVRRAQRRQATEDAARAAAAQAAAVDPIARVLVDVPLAHLDRDFDYLVPAAMADEAVPGARVRVRFAGKDVAGFVLERLSESDHDRPQPLRSVVSSEPVLLPEVARLAASVAERYAGTRADVLRLAIPPRHAATEKRPSEPESPRAPGSPSAEAWAGHAGAADMLAGLARGEAPRAVWTAAPGTDWPAALAVAVAATHAAGRGALVCLPDHRDVARLDAALVAALGEGHHVVLTADAGPAKRYARFLQVARGTRRIVIGTRAAAFAPVQELGLVAIWDDGDDLYAEPRAPYPHTREVLLTRAEQTGCAALVGAFARSAEAQLLVASRWAREIVAPREEIRSRVSVAVAGASDADLARDPLARAARMPAQVHALLRSALETGPVLVQTPRAGYAAALACDRCRTPARCGDCRGPLRQPDALHAPVCAWCGLSVAEHVCPECGGRGLRAPVVGDARTAEELGRAFPGVPVLTSSGDRVKDTVPDRPAIVVATPGAEPVAAGPVSGSGYAAVVLLDTWIPLAREELRAAEEALRRWLTAAALVRRGGQVLAVGEAGHPALQALVRWDPVGFAEREIAVRREAHLPPATRVASLSGEAGALDDALTLLDPPHPIEVLGPVPHGDTWQVVLRTPRRNSAALSAALRQLQRTRSARKLDPVRVQVDPIL